MAPKPKPKPPSPKKPKPLDPEENPGIVKKISRLLGLSPPAKSRVPGCCYRLKNMFKCHWRGIIGFWGVWAILGYVFDMMDNSKKLEAMWATMAWLFFIRPISIPCTGLIPIFFLPMTGVMSSKETCGCYMNADIMLFLLGSMVMLLLNNCGNDRRIALSIMAFGDTDQFSAQKMVFKCSTASYILGILSNRLVSSSMITEYFTEAMISVEKKYGQVPEEPELEEVRYVVNNAIQTSSSIGSVALIPSSTAILCFRAIYNQLLPRTLEFPDLFNYLQYTAFAFPVSLLIFILNLLYHLILVWRQADGEMSVNSKALLERAIKNSKSKLPKDVTLHEKLCISALVLSLVFHFYRWSYWFGGWSRFALDKNSIPEMPLPAIKDATVAAFFAVLLHSLPCGFNFLKYIVVSKRKDLPKLKAESGILWWKYVDKNVNYGYFFLIGSGVAIMAAAAGKTMLCMTISQHLGTVFTDSKWQVGMFLVVCVTTIIANIVSPTAACVIILPAVICGAHIAPMPWPARIHLGALAVGMGCTYGFAYPYLYTPAYFCHYVGKVPIKKMIKYSVISIIIAILATWVNLAYFAPVVWDPEDRGIPALGPIPTTPAPITEATTIPAEADAPAPPPAED